MAIENVGPGGVGNNYGVRETVARERYELDKEYIEEYTDADGKVVTSKVDPVTGGVEESVIGTVFPTRVGTNKQSVSPILLAPSGSFTNTSGAFALGTALAYTPAETVLMYLPAGAGGLAGGALYECTFSSTTVGQIVGNPTTTATSWTQQTTAATLFSSVVPANTLGAGASMDVDVLVGCNSSAGTKSVVCSFGGTSVISQSLTTSQSGKFSASVCCISGSKQVRSGLVGIDSSSTNALGQMSVDLSADNAVAVTGQLAVATDWLMLQLVRPVIYKRGM